MVVRHVLVERPPPAVWAVLSDGGRYADWVVGTHDSREAEGEWPAVGSSIAYCVKVGPVKLRNKTVVRVCDEGTRLELEAYAGPLGTARIAIEVRPWGRSSLVIIDEHPLRGPSAAVHNSLIDMMLMVRHRNMLTRLAKVVERSTPASSNGRADA
ncbi:SRPBCC family protein [Streptomyces sp. SID13666]|uniref:SRPBCC family protein n=1 Tax=unclassified Streptomyces TaxID=2593676 RepID=UPI0013C149DD|nr:MULTISPECIES: SRPBCC family protein [unclassified Streptomyces]NEA59794.1 SRPBCC family protein [Streptomyces sp. SID13666]NEA76785.1 SRPBCC family protein [Streptomyces sp. SID13588]